MKRVVVDPKLFSQLEGIRVRAARPGAGHFMGLHRSLHRGSSVEFAQHREYAPGDPIGRVDWKVFAKNDRFFVKEYDDETNLRVFIALDASESMAYGVDGEADKMTSACRLVAGLAWFLLKQGDAVGLVTFGEGIRSFIPPNAQASHFWRMVGALEQAVPKGATQLSKSLDQIAERCPRGSFVLLVSDMLEFDERFLGRLKQLQRRHQQVVVLHILHRHEITFPFDELTLFEGLEGGAEILADPRGMKAEYLKAFAGWQAQLRTSLLDGNVAYFPWVTDTPAHQPIYQILEGRAP